MLTYIQIHNVRKREILINTSFCLADLLHILANDVNISELQICVSTFLQISCMRYIGSVGRTGVCYFSY